MEVNRERMLECLRQALRLEYTRLHYGEARPSPPPGVYGNFTGDAFRFILPLTGTKHICFAQGKALWDLHFVPGEVLFVQPNGWSAELWDSPHTMLSVVFRYNTLRTLFIDHPGTPPPPNGPDVYFHTARPVSAAGLHLAHSILEAEAGAPSALLAFRALLALILESVAQDTGPAPGKEDFTWELIQTFLDANFHRNLTREDIARSLHLHPAHLSRLVKKRANCSVTQYVTDLRIRHAAALLDDDSLTIDEIAGRCGYSYTSYFIRLFRQHYSESPARHRSAKAKSQRTPPGT